MIWNGDTGPQENYQKLPEIQGTLLLLSTTNGGQLVKIIALGEYADHVRIGVLVYNPAIVQFARICRD